MPRTMVIAALALLSGNALTAQAPSGTRFEGWNLAYAAPAGWRLTQQQGRVHTLAPPSNDMVLYVVAGPYQSFDDVAAELPKAFQLLGLAGAPASAPVSSTVKGMSAMTADYIGQDRTGQPIQARVTALLTAQGSGLLALGFARAGAAGPLVPALESVMQGVEVAGAPQSDLSAVAALRGRWIFYAGRADGVSSVMGGSSRSYEETVEFDGAGRFAWSSSASVSVTTPGTGGTAGGANASSDQGTYTVIGTTLVVRGRQGTASYELQIAGDRFVADGRTFVRAN